MKEFAYKIIRKLAYCCLSIACKMIGLMMRYYESEIFYKVLGTKHGYNIEFIFLPDDE